MPTATSRRFPIAHPGSHLSCPPAPDRSITVRVSLHVHHSVRSVCSHTRLCRDDTVTKAALLNDKLIDMHKVTQLQSGGACFWTGAFQSWQCPLHCTAQNKSEASTAEPFQRTTTSGPVPRREPSWHRSLKGSSSSEFHSGLCQNYLLSTAFPHPSCPIGFHLIFLWLPGLFFSDPLVALTSCSPELLESGYDLDLLYYNIFEGK